MRTVGSSMNHSDKLANLRSSATSGLRVLRSEVQRSRYVIVRGGSTVDNKRDFTNLDSTNHPEYRGTITKCKNLAGNRIFNPLFGLKITELTNPVIYGLGLSQNGKSYALIRCGPPVNPGGSYGNDDVTPNLATILENIGQIPCTKATGTCTVPQIDGKDMTLAQIVAAVDTRLEKTNISRPGTYLQPALAIRTDGTRKLLKLVDPTEPTDSIKFSFLQLPGHTNTASTNLDMMAYAKADKIDRADGYYGELEGDGFYGIPVIDNAVIIVDGSGSMSACIKWGSTHNSVSRIYYDYQVFNYISTTQNCLANRMEVLQNELRNLLLSMPSDSRIGLMAFSSTGYSNHKNWKNGALTELNNANRADALAFVNSLSTGYVPTWGGTSPWGSLDSAFANNDARAIYLMTDGEPNLNRDGGGWSSSFFPTTATYYINTNNKRANRLAVNTISVGQDSSWLKLISDGTGGTYKMVTDIKRGP